MRISRLLLVLMTVPLVACDLSGDQAAATPAVAAQSAGLSQTASDTLVVLRRLSVGPNSFVAYDVAQDGSFLVIDDTPTGDLAVADPRSRETRLVNPRNTGSWDVGWTEGAVVSPDGKRIAYNWWIEPDTFWGYQFRIVNLDGSNDRPLLENENREPLRENGFIGGFIEPWAWTADGWILGVGEEDWEPGRPETLMLISEKDGETRTLKEFGEGVGVGKADLSPDGRYVAYQIRPEPGANIDIHVLSIVTGRETQVTRSPGHERLLGWVPGQDAILFHADNSVWRLQMSEGEALGVPELLRADVWEMRPIGFQDEGFMYEVRIDEASLYRVSLDLEAGKEVGPVNQITTLKGGGMPAWSPDDRFLATWESTGIVVRTEESGEQRDMPIPTRNAWNLQWHPDGGSIFFFGSRPNTPESAQALYELDLTTEEVRLVSDATGIRSNEALSPDGTTRYFSPGPAPRWIMAQNLETGATRRVLGSEGVFRGRISVSRDGSMLAYRASANDPTNIDRSVVKVLPAAGGEALVVFPIPDSWSTGGSRAHFPWTPDGQHVLVGAVVQNEALTIVKVPVDGGEPTTLLTYGEPDFWGDDLLDLNLSPDGRHMAFVWEISRKEIWLMQGY